MNLSVSLFFFYLFTKSGQIRGSVSAVLSLPVLTMRRKFQRHSHKDPFIPVLIIIICSALHIVKIIILFRGHHLCFASAYFEGLKLILSNIVERL